MAMTDGNLWPCSRRARCPCASCPFAEVPDAFVRNVGERSLPLGGIPAARNPGNRADGRFCRDSKGPLEFAFLGGLGAGTMLARSPSEDGKK